MLHLPVAPRYLLSPLLLIAISVLIVMTPLNSLLEFNRDAVQSGEFWRILSGQFAHANVAHLLLNCAGVALIWALHGEYYSPKHYFTALLLLSLWCGVAIWLLCPDIHIYTGLSGVLHGMVVLGACIDIIRGEKTGYLLLGGTWAKVAWEFYHGPSQDIELLIASRVAIEAHLAGAAGGTVLGLMYTIKKRLQ